MTDANALNVIKVLNANGFQAYLVGGCVRDALCGVKPKDFDVATDAPLETVSKLFRRSRIVEPAFSHCTCTFRPRSDRGIDLSPIDFKQGSAQ